MLHYFRQNSKIILAVFGVILIMTWLIIPAITDMMQSNNNGSMEDPVVVTWKGGRFTRSELNHLKKVHSATRNFVSMVIEETRRRNGTPRAPGYVFLSPERGIIGISSSISDQSLMNTVILARRAKELGVVVSDETVKQFLDKLGDYMLKEADLARLIAESIPDAGAQVTQGAIFEHLKSEILAQEMQIMAQAGVNSINPGDLTGMRLQFEHGMAPPGEMWKLYERFNRKVKIEAFPLKVSDFLDKVTAQPTDAELQKLFEEGRMTPPNPEFPFPGFRRPHRVAFEYVKVDNIPFLEAAKKEITDEQIAAEYEKGKAAGRFKVEDKPAEKPAEVKPGEAPTDPSRPADPAKPGEGKPADEKPAENKPTEEKPAEPKSGDAKPADEPKAAEPEKPEPKKNEGSALARDIQLVNFQDDKKAEETKPAEAKPAETKPAEATPAPPAGTPPAAAPPAATEANPTDPTKPAAPQEIKFKPLEEVKDEIRTQLAQPIAAERRQALIGKVMTAVSDHSRKYNRWRMAAERQKQPGAPKKSELTEPAPLNLEPLLGEFKFKVEKVPLSDRHEIRKFEIGRDAYRFDTQTFQQLPFAAIAFQENVNLFLPETLPFAWDNKQFAGLAPTIWLYWRTDEQQAKELDFKEARDQVVAFWKQQEALKLAKAAATNLAEAASKGKELKAVVPDAKAIVEPPPFTWMTTGSLGDQFGQSTPTMSSVTGVEFAGEDFMRPIFDLKVGEAAVALNQPHSTVWVARLVSEESDLEKDRARFIETANSQTLLFSAFQEQGQLMQDLYRELIERFDVRWSANQLDPETQE